MENRYIFRYNVKYLQEKFPSDNIPNDAICYFGTYWNMSQFFAGLEDADIVLFHPPQDWITMEEEGKGKILPVLVTIKIIEEEN